MRSTTNWINSDSLPQSSVAVQVRTITPGQSPGLLAITATTSSLQASSLLKVEIGGVGFAPGDLVIADVDGVVVVPQEVEREAVQHAWAKVHAENVTRDAIQQGMKATEAFEKYGIL